MILCYDLSKPAINISHSQVNGRYILNSDLRVALYVNEKVTEFSTAISDKSKEIVKKPGKSLQQL